MHRGENVRLVIFRINIDLVPVGDEIVPAGAEREGQAEEQTYVSQQLLRICRRDSAPFISCVPAPTALRISAAAAQSATAPRIARAVRDRAQVRAMPM